MYSNFSLKKRARPRENLSKVKDVGLDGLDHVLIKELAKLKLAMNNGKNLEKVY